MIRLIVYLGIAAASGAALIVLDPKSIAFTLISAVAIGFLVPVVDACIRHFGILRIAFMAIRSWRHEVRVSVAYLIQIKVENTYLLIKSRRSGNFQPVGGVFKFHPAGRSFLESIHALNDNLYPIDTIGIDDLRVRIRGKYLVRFFTWFRSRRGRETDAWREFQEELIASGILPTEVFKFVHTEYLGTRDTGLRWSEYVQSKEIIVAEIYRLIPTAAQSAALSDLRDTETSELYWATESEIKRRGAEPNRGIVAPISEHSSWII